MADLGAKRVADGDYMSVWEFSRLTIDQQCDVWAAVEHGRITFVPYSNVRCYHREQVRLLLAQSCRECKGTGLVDVDGCNCGTGPGGHYGQHERFCGSDACPNGCWDVLNPAVTV